MPNKLPPRRRPPVPVRSPLARAAISNTVVAWAERYALSPAEFDLLLAVATRPTFDREALARNRRVTPDTVKSHARAVCRRTGTKSLAHAALLILNETLAQQVARAS